jgi:pantoate kinase
MPAECRPFELGRLLLCVEKHELERVGEWQAAELAGSGFGTSHASALDRTLKVSVKRSHG